jgi:hypothetical protein
MRSTGPRPVCEAQRKAQCMGFLVLPTEALCANGRYGMGKATQLSWASAGRIA